MVSKPRIVQKSGFEGKKVRGKNRLRAMRHPNYVEQTKLRNTHTGELLPVYLVDPQSPDHEDLFGVIDHPELRRDLKAAFESFTPLEQRILFRVLVQGYALRDAAARLSRRSWSWWRLWMRTVALPKLRKCLEAYRDEVRELPYLVKRLEKESSERATMTYAKCRHCPKTFKGQGEDAFFKLRIHAAEDHRTVFVAVKKSLRDCNEFLQRAVEDFV